MSEVNDGSIEWGLPEEQPRYTPRLRWFADALKSHPGEWAKWPRVPAKASTLAAQLRNGNEDTYKAFLPRHDFEVKVVKGVVYVRYVGHERSPKKG